MLAIIAAVLCASLVPMASGPGEPHPVDVPTSEAAQECFARGEWAKAATAYEELTRQPAAKGQYWYRLAVCRLNLKEDKAALAVCDAALTQGAPEGSLTYVKARALTRLGRKDEAVRCLEKSVTAGFARAPQLRQEDDLAALRSEPAFVALLDKLEHPTRGLPGADALDHWVGEWDVYVNGQLGGHNRIVKALNGFAVEEFWEGAGAGRGRSLFVYEAAKGRWKQLWTSDAGWVVEKVGTPVENGIYLEGTSTFANGTIKKSREYLTRNPDGSVRQLLEDWDEASKSWKPTFDGKYVRKQGAPRAGGTP